MHSSYRKAIVAVGLVLLVGGMASGQVPPNNDKSDDNGNTGGGSSALYSITGFDNTAYGWSALSGGTGSNYGHDNTAIGSSALWRNSTGSANTASGKDALALNTMGAANTAVGKDALVSNDIGNYNTASGYQVVFSNNGIGNTASGYQSLYYNITGNYNTAHGYGALLRTTGSNNIALGANAGLNLTSGSNNIDIGHPGVAGEASTIRVGNGQTQTFIAGIAGKTVVGTPVVIASNGQLGVVLSSARYKHDIQPMGTQSQGLLKLRPVTFRYKEDAQGGRQYGLIAEEVATVYPELVTTDTHGQVEAVQYHELIPMLLNELQRQQQQLGLQARQLTVQSQELAELQAQNASLRTALQAQNAALMARLVRLEEGEVRQAVRLSPSEALEAVRQ